MVKTEEQKRRNRLYAQRHRFKNRLTTLEKEKEYRSRKKERLKENYRRHYVKKQTELHCHLPRKK
jgi:hypothetical protein